MDKHQATRPVPPDATPSTLPLSARPLTYARVERITVEPDAVLVPLIPLGNPEFLQRTVEDMLALLDQGWSWTHAAPWLKKFVTRPTFRTLHARYAADHAAPAAHEPDPFTHQLLSDIRDKALKARPRVHD